MATPRRRKDLALIDQLKHEPHRFEFFQAVRILETASAHDHSQQYARAPVATLAQPGKEAIRFTCSEKLHFIGEDILSVGTEPNGEESSSGEKQLRWLMNVSFFGLAGAQGVLPYRFSELIQQEQKNKNTALKDFFDLFNHRSTSLFHQAWYKYRLPANYERARQSGKSQRDLFTRAILSLAGLGTSELHYRLPFPDELVAGLTAGFARQITTASDLKGMIRQAFGLDVSISQFQGQWQPLDAEVACRLPDQETGLGINNQLGINAVIGSYCYHAQSKFSVVIAPLPYKRFMELAPGTRKLEALKSMIKLAVGTELEFDIAITTTKNKVPPCRLVQEEDYLPTLGWNTHLHAEDVDSIEPIDIHLSQSIEQPEEGLQLATT